MFQNIVNAHRRPRSKHRGTSALILRARENVPLWKTRRPERALVICRKDGFGLGYRRRRQQGLKHLMLQRSGELAPKRYSFLVRVWITVLREVCPVADHRIR